MPATGELRVLIIGHDRRVRRALAELLAAEPGIDVCGTVAYRRALAAANAQQPDAALIDLPQPNPAEGLRLISLLHHRDIPVIALSDSASLGQEALPSGAVAYVEKDGNLHRIPQSLRALNLPRTQ